MNFGNCVTPSEAATFLKAVPDMQPLPDKESGNAAIETATCEIMREFPDRRTNTLRGYVLPEGIFTNTPEGRRINVGLTFQTMRCLWLSQQAWGEETGGLGQYIDMKSQPSIFPNVRHKWAWVQTKAVSCLMKGYFQTRHSEGFEWFKCIHEYTFAYFPDPKHIG